MYVPKFESDPACTKPEPALRRLCNPIESPCSHNKVTFRISWFQRAPGLFSSYQMAEKAALHPTESDKSMH